MFNSALTRWSEMFHRFGFPQLIALVAKAKFLHVLPNDKFSAPFVELIRRRFNENGHVFVFYGGYKQDVFALPPGKNVIHLKNSSEFLILDLLLRRSRKIFFHGLFSRQAIEFLSKRPRQLAKAHWIIWGGDLYGDLSRKPEDEAFLLKQSVVRHLKAIVTVTPGDFDTARKLYDFKGLHFSALYRNPLKLEHLRQKTKVLDNALPLVHINNSADQSTLGMLNILARFRGKIRVRTVVSYGDLTAKDPILEAGTRLFGSDFLPLIDYVTPEEYGALMAEADVLIMNQPRQQGLGNLYGFLYLGTKVYVRSDTTTWAHLIQKEFVVSDTLEMGGASLQELTHLAEDHRTQNQQNAAILFDDEYISSHWQKMFES